MSAGRTVGSKDEEEVKEEKVKEEGSLVTEKGTKPEQSTTDGEWSVNPTLRGRAVRRTQTLKSDLLWDPGFALGTSLHFSGLSVFICEMVVLILMLQSNAGKTADEGAGTMPGMQEVINTSSVSHSLSKD